MTEERTSPEQGQPPRWQPLSAIDRRVAGVLVEKAKTTPSAYPLSLNAVCAACNQKSNREPLMSLEPDEVEESLDRLRKMGAVGLIEGHGRVAKYRHYLYDWLGVDKVEIAVMAELLLRGEQTLGELRGRAARMEAIRDLAALQPILASLKSKRLVIPLSPEGRGHLVTHGLLPPKELEKVSARCQGTPTSPTPAAAVQPQASHEPVPSLPASPTAVAAPDSEGAGEEVAEALKGQIQELRSQVAQLRSDLEDLTGTVKGLEDEVGSLRNDLGG